jgi:serine/threonine protein kinase/tetratricopeptide (TPR) repeat protein
MASSESLAPSNVDGGGNLMTPERWRQIDQVFQSALECAPDDRAAFINEACGDDEFLRREVEALLAADGIGGSFIESPAYEMAAPLIAGEEAPSLLGKNVGHYHIISLIGSGGMGVVYRARDVKLDRIVALKTLPAEFAVDQERMHRFIREAKSASALNHPNVAHIYEIGEAEGVNFIAMEYVEGQSLTTKIEGRPLDFHEIVEIGGQIADALDEAHSKGITHRDIKPANAVLTSRGQVKVLDFGLAKIDKPESVGSEISTLTLTSPGLVLGTAPYMSPEQALGREVDHRSDLFSLGVVLYEMTTGRTPFAGANITVTLDRILHSEPEAMARFNYNTPAELERIVRKCLEKERECRYQSARELLVDLNNLKRENRSSAANKVQLSPRHGSRRAALIALAATLLASGGFSLYALLPTAKLNGSEVNTLVVLPFNPLTSESHDEALEIGMADTLINRLSGVRRLIVRPVSAVRRYAGVEHSAIAVGKEQQVDAVLESNFQRLGDRIRVTARLLRVADGTTIWAGKFDEQSTDLFAIQDGISEQVAQALSLRLTDAERGRLVKHDTKNKDAFLHYQKGRFFWNKRTAETIKKSVEYFNQAIEKDPDYALAYVGLADAYHALPIYGGSRFQDSFPKAKEAATRAVALDKTLAEAHSSMANALYFNDWNLPESNREFQTALTLDPNYASAHQSYGERNLMVMGRTDEALTHLKRAQELDPISLAISTDIGSHYIKIGQPDKAIEQLRKTLEMDQHFYGAHRLLGKAYESKGSFQESLAAFERAYQLNDTPLVLGQMGHLYAASGRKIEALRILDQLKEISRQRYVSAYEFAIIYAGLGDKDQTLQWLENGYQEHNPFMLILTVDPYFVDLRSDPSFAELVRRVGMIR